MTSTNPDGKEISKMSKKYQVSSQSGFWKAKKRNLHLVGSLRFYVYMHESESYSQDAFHIYWISDFKAIN